MKKLIFILILFLSVSVLAEQRIGTYHLDLTKFTTQQLQNWVSFVKSYAGGKKNPGLHLSLLLNNSDGYSNKLSDYDIDSTEAIVCLTDKIEILQAFQDAVADDKIIIIGYKTITDNKVLRDEGFYTSNNAIRDFMLRNSILIPYKVECST